MSGHNKWSQIKRQKEAGDAKKSRRFSMLARAITLEARRANGDRNASSLKTAIEKARAENLPNENIERAIKAAIGGKAADLTEVLYEAYLPVRQAGGPGGVAIVIEGITDNKNRTAQEIKHLLNEHHATFVAPGSVTWAFRKSNNYWQALTTILIGAEERAALTSLITALENHANVRAVSSNAASQT